MELDLHNQPGQYFVVATLLPLASFLLLLVVGGLRRFLRPRRESALAGSLYQALGGDSPGRAAAYVATAAMGLAFLCSAYAGVKYFHEVEKLHAHAPAKSDAGHDHGGHDHGKEAHAKHDDHAHEDFDKRWSGQVTYALLNFGAIKPDPSAAAQVKAMPATALKLGFHIDSLTVVMFMMVTFIATLIHIFSIGYMADELQETVEDHQVHTEDGHLKRRGRFGQFFLFLSLFCFSMLNLVLADNLFQVFISWELVGICSYLLIGFYYERTSASNAANKAFITNRIGDAGFIIGVLILWTYVGTLNFDELFQQIRSPLRDPHGPLERAGQIVRADVFSVEESTGVRVLQVTPPDTGSEVILFPRKLILDEDNEAGHFHGLDTGKKARIHLNPAEDQFRSMPYWLLVAAGLGIFLGCVGKSAQFPLHVWLPDAMEGPTPVSALIHAATMVAAGVYLVGRCFPLFTPESRLVIAYTGAITLFVAATIAIVMTDIKKVLAYSTVSQLGYMMLALGVGGWVAGLFHLLTHAFFKALLFLGSGSVIYGCHHEQEMTKMGGLYPKMRVTALTMLVGVLTIAGTPFFSGWYSKDAILAQALGFVTVHKQHVLLFILPLLTAGITTFYMFRMWFLTFTGEPRDHHVYEHAHESPKVMTVPLVILAVCSVCVAWGWPLWDAEASFLGQKLHHGMYHHVAADFGKVIDTQKLLPDGRRDPNDLGEDRMWPEIVAKHESVSERIQAFKAHSLAELLALLSAGAGVVFALLLYYVRVLDPAEAYEQFQGLYRLLARKWYFDELYSAILVRPALAVAGWCRSFDLGCIDGFVDGLGRWTVRAARGSGWVDLGIVDGLANLLATVTQNIGARLRTVQTGYIRSYVLFLVLAAIGIFAVLSYFVTWAVAQ